MTTITRLTPLNVRALRECFPNQVKQGFLVLTATTATWETHTPESALIQVETMIRRLPTRGHPKASLHAVARKLRAHPKHGPQGLRDILRLQQ